MFRFKYNFSFDDKLEINDIVFGKVIIDKVSLRYNFWINNRF